MLTAHGFTTPKCRPDAMILTVSTHGQLLCLSIPRLSGPADEYMSGWHVRCGNAEMPTCSLRGYFCTPWSVNLVGVIMWSSAGWPLSP